MRADAVVSTQAKVSRVVQRPFVSALSVCIEQVSVGKGNERHGNGLPFCDQPWVDLARKHRVGFLTGQAEKKWIEAETSIIAKDDERWVREVTGAIVYSLMALIWLVPMEQGAARLTESQRAMSPAAWLIGAWPLEQPRTNTVSLGWPSADTMRAVDLIVSIQNSVLHMAYALCKRLDKMGLRPPVVEFAG